MPIIHYPGYISKEEAAKRYNVQVRTIRDWMRKTSSPPEHFHYRKVGEFVCVKDVLYTGTYPEIPFQQLEQVRPFAARHKISYEKLYEDIITGKITGVVLCDHIFVINTEPQLLARLSTYKQKGR